MIKRNIGETISITGGAEVTPRFAVTRHYMPGSMNNSHKALEITQDGKQIILSAETMAEALKWASQNPNE